MDERTPPMTPQLALRVAMVGGLALLLFAIVFFRLWFLQVLSGSKYVAEAQSNHVQYVPVAAPRGEIVDSSDTALVQSVAVPSVQIAPRSLPAPIVFDGGLKYPVVIPSRDDALFGKLATLLGLPTKPHRCTYTVFWSAGPHTYTTQLATVPCRIAMSVAQAQFANVTIKTNVPTYIQDFISERITQFPGVLTQDTYVRRYPLGVAGAQLFGTLNQITQSEVGTKPYKGILSGSIVGQTGLEREYNWALQGLNGKEGIKVNSQGQFDGYANETRPTVGNTLRLSISAPLETVGQNALRQSIAINGGSGGAFVALNPQNGQIYAMGSAPSYDPSIFTHPVSTSEYQRVFGKGSNDPLLNRAIQGVGADGSTFKVITATAALESGVWGVGDTYGNNTSWCFPGTTDCLRNSNNESFGTIDLTTAIEDSVDTFFYNLGYLLNTHPTVVANHPHGGALQQWARRFGLGHTTGVDLPGEYTGQVPDPALVTARYREEIQCETATGQYAYTDPATGQISAKKLPGYVRSKKVPGGCGISNSSLQTWTEGDNVNMAIGQGFVQVTPLQLAVVYAALENGGSIVTPHVAQSVQSPAGQILQQIDPAPKRNLHLNPVYLDAIRNGLALAAKSGTSGDVMGTFPKTVYGKTGTAQYGNNIDDAWYACFVPDSEKPIVIVTWVEKGGYGDVAAAPIAREMLNQWFYGKPGSFHVGINKTL